ncbi:O-antigen ligase family protein [Neptuniibacter sp. QD29_5]|uniref:O-antigen ligase family protein n=1 Tax=Neptuniibacter sp. QD29_5 TaxID=3398207 RepID=UPI0039F5AC6A
MKSENNVFLFQKAMVDIGVFVGIVYVLIVFLANYGFELNLLSSKFYYQHGLVRIAFFWNEPLLMGFYFAAISRVAWFNEREVVSNFLLVASIASLSFSGLIFALVSYVSRYRFYEYLSDCKRLASILFIICTVCLVFYSVLGERVSDIVNLQDSSLRIRLAMIVASLNVFMEYPIFGIGWGESGKIIHQYITVFSSAFGNSSPKPQSVWLLMLSEIGLYGVIMFLIGLFYLIENKRSSSFFLLMPAVLFTVSGIAILPMIFVLLALSSVVDIYKESQSV